MIACGNPVATKKFPTETLLKMIDSSVKNVDELEYDNQNSLQHQKLKFGRNNLNWELPPITTVNKSVHNKKVIN